MAAITTRNLFPVYGILKGNDAENSPIIDFWASPLLVEAGLGCSKKDPCWVSGFRWEGGQEVGRNMMNEVRECCLGRRNVIISTSMIGGDWGHCHIVVGCVCKYVCGRNLSCHRLDSVDTTLPPPPF